MAEGIVDILEVVDVEEDEGERRFDFLRSRHGEIEFVLKEALVVEAGQIVGQAEFAVMILNLLESLLFRFQELEPVGERHREENRFGRHAYRHRVDRQEIDGENLEAHEAKDESPHGQEGPGDEEIEGRWETLNEARHGGYDHHDGQDKPQIVREREGDVVPACETRQAYDEAQAYQDQDDVVEDGSSLL